MASQAKYTDIIVDIKDGIGTIKVSKLLSVVSKAAADLFASSTDRSS